MPPIAGTKVAQEGDGRDHAAHAACTDQVGDAPVVEELGQPLAFRRGGRGAPAPGQVAGRPPGSEITFRYPCQRGQYVAHEDASEPIGIVGIHRGCEVESRQAGSTASQKWTIIAGRWDGRRIRTEYGKKVENR